MQKLKHHHVAAGVVWMALGMASTNAQAQNPTPFMNEISPVAAEPESDTLPA